MLGTGIVYVMTSVVTDTGNIHCGPAIGMSDGTAHGMVRWGLFRDLRHPRQIVSNITPNWYASIMGTAIVAVAATSLPLQFPGFRVLATSVWVVAVILLVGLTAATGLHWRYYRATARGHLLDPVMANFYGAPPMAMMTVGAGALLLGKDIFGLQLALQLDWVLWFTGTIMGLACATVVPYLILTRHQCKPESAFGGWLMPVVPPMVSASTGALLIPYAPPGPLRVTMLLCCYAMFGMSLLLSAIVITLICYRLARHNVGPARMVPALWIVLGPLGQSITAANLLGGVAPEAVPAPYSTALQAFGVLYGLPVLGFALLWAGIAGTITYRTARVSLPFSLTWWSFTFPVGTCVTGTSALALSTGSTGLAVGAVILYLLLLLAWCTVATRTARGSLRGRLFLSAAPAQRVTGPVTACA